MYVYMYVCICVYMYVCIYTWMQTVKHQDVMDKECIVCVDKHTYTHVYFHVLCVPCASRPNFFLYAYEHILMYTYTYTYTCMYTCLYTHKQMGVYMGADCIYIHLCTCVYVCIDVRVYASVGCMRIRIRAYIRICESPPYMRTFVCVFVCICNHTHYAEPLGILAQLSEKKSKNLLRLQSSCT